MKMPTRSTIGRRVLVAGGTALTVSMLTKRSALAAPYPENTIRIIVPYPAGTTTDLFTRQFSTAFSDAMNQRILIDNRGGADAIIGTALAAKAAPDGYTLFIGTSQTLAINPSLHATLPYDPAVDFTPIARLATQAEIMVISATIPARTLPEFNAYAKTKLGKLNYASTGVGSGSHLAGAYYSHLAGLEMTHTPYKSAAQAFSDLASGDVALTFYPYLAMKSLIDAGKLRILATASPERVPYLPDVPTLVELGYPQLVVTIWFGLYGPRGVPQDIVNTISAAVGKAMLQPELLALFKASGTDVSLSSPSELGQFTRAEAQKFSEMVKLSGAHSE